MLASRPGPAVRRWYQLTSTGSVPTRTTFIFGPEMFGPVWPSTGMTGVLDGSGTR